METNGQLHDPTALPPENNEGNHSSLHEAEWDPDPAWYGLEKKEISFTYTNSNPGLSSTVPTSTVVNPIHKLLLNIHYLGRLKWPVTNGFVLGKQRPRVMSAASPATILHIAYPSTSIINTHRKKRSILNGLKAIMEATTRKRLRKAGSMQVASTQKGRRNLCSFFPWLALVVIFPLTLLWLKPKRRECFTLINISETMYFSNATLTLTRDHYILHSNSPLLTIPTWEYLMWISEVGKRV